MAVRKFVDRVRWTDRQEESVRRARDDDREDLELFGHARPIVLTTGAHPDASTWILRGVPRGVNAAVAH